MSGLIRIAFLIVFVTLLAGGMALDAFNQPPDPIFKALMAVLP